MLKRGLVGSTAILLFAGCVGENEALPCADGKLVSRLYGDVIYESGCTDEDIELLDDSMVLGRIASNTQAFSDCVNDRITQDYIPCNGDPFGSANLSEK